MDLGTTMDGRISACLLTIPFTMLCAGCIASQTPKAVAPAPTTQAPATQAPIERSVKVKKDDGPKRNPLPSTEVAFGELKEGEADSDAGKKNPEAQARLRDEARQAYQKALKIDPNNLEGFRHLGRLYAKKNDFDHANEIYKKALAKYPKDATLWYDLGVCYNRRKDFGESLRCFNKALELDPENPKILMKIGFTYTWLGQVDQGLASLKLAQGSALAHYNVARILLQKDQNESALRHLRLALRENSQLQEARDLLTSLEAPTPDPVRRAVLASPVAG